METKDELDRWAVPAKLRTKLFTLERIGLGGLVIMFVWLFINCMRSNASDNKENANEWKEMYKNAVRPQVQAAKREVLEKQDSIDQVIDSTKRQVESLLKKSK